MTTITQRIMGTRVQNPPRSVVSLEAEQSEHLPQQLLLESQIMAKYALTSGYSIPPATVHNIDEFSRLNGNPHSPEQLKQLVVAHKKLVEIVHPAKPKTLVLLFGPKEKRRLRGLICPVPMVSQMTAMALVFMAIFIGLSVFQMDNGIPENAADFRLIKLLELLYLLAAAGLGAAFAALFKANRFIVAGTFDPAYAFSYWIRFTLGMMAGLILAMLIPLNNAESVGLTPILLALLGGFSADVLYRILTRLIDTLESIVQGKQHNDSEGQS